MLNYQHLFTFLSFFSEEVLFYGPECPYMYKGKQDLSFEERFDVLVTNVDSRGICTKQPLRVQENAAFVIQRSALKGKGDWLVTDLGSFSNLGQWKSLASGRWGYLSQYTVA